MIVDLAQWIGLESAGYIFLPRPWNVYFAPLIHGTSAVAWCGSELLHSPKPPVQRDDAENTNSEYTENHQMILNFSRSYFIFDLLKVSRNPTKNWLMITHHVLTLWILYIFEKYKKGRMLLELLFWGEMTNPLYNIRAAMGKSQNNWLYRLINHVFAWSFWYLRLVRLPQFTNDVFHHFHKNMPPQYTSSTVDTDYQRLRKISFVMNIANGIWSLQLVIQYLRWIVQQK